MKKKGLLLDAAIGLVLTLVVALSYLRQDPFLASVEFKAYDARAKFRESLKSPDEIVLVAIDDDAISQVGRWPWPRTRVASMIDRVAQDKPRVIGLNILFSEPEENLGLGEVRRLEDRYKELLSDRKIVQRGVDFGLELSSTTAALDSDSKLLASVSAAGNVVMPLFFVDNPSRAKQPPVVAEISSGAVKAAGVPEDSVSVAYKMIPPLASFVGAAAGFGHANLSPESDGVVRQESPLIQYDGMLYPSFALRLAMAYYDVKPSDLRFAPGVAVSAGKLRVPVDAYGEMPITFLGPPSADVLKRVTYQTLMSGSLGKDYFKDKIVLIGLTATGVQTNWATPLAGSSSSVDVIANSLENILHQRYLTRPPWARQAELAALALIGLFIMLVLPRLRAFWGLVVSTLLAVVIVSAGLYFFVSGEWIKIGYALSLLLGGYLVVISKSFLVTEKGKELVEASAIETNKMLGLSFQGQGMLDLAFEKFRLCPLDANMKDTLYNLSLDFERKRQYSKAAAVLDHIAAKDPKFKDVVEKAAKLKQASDGAVFGGVGAKKEGTVMITGGATKPTLGRYEIEKELGRGAMGVVYLGRDPKINRMVAIKTMMLEEGGSEAEAKEVKERFFREAESAGTLNHPNIVRIFDAGEENEVAYIAMELLDGHDLTKNCAKDNLLPLQKTIEYVATVADALDYAHAQGIVHRDIKPANIMLLKDGTVRVADFGIARIAASSKTATGTVMGTPSYMSPEQVAGKKVDGRSDLFSLSVALYELATGEKPFKGGEGIGTLLFQIANDQHPDPLIARPDLPPALKAVLDKGLAKKADERYQRGSEMAAALRGVLAQLAGGAAAPAPAAAPAAEKTVAAAAERTAVSTAEVAATSTLETTAPSVPAPARPAAPPAADRTLDAQKTVRIGPEITIPGLNDAPVAAPTPIAAPVRAPEPTVPLPGPVRPPAEPTAPIPGPVHEAAALPPPPAAETAGGLKLELPQRGGVGPAAEVPTPDKAAADGTMRIEPTQSPDGTLKLKAPHPHEPL